MTKTILLACGGILILGIGAGIALQLPRHHADATPSVSQDTAPDNLERAPADALPLAHVSDAASDLRAKPVEATAVRDLAPAAPMARPAPAAVGISGGTPSSPPTDATVSAWSQEIRINFQHPSTHTPDGYLPDTGLAFGPRGQALSYGWVDGPATEARERNVLPDKRYDTFIHLTKGPSQLGPHQNAPGAPGGSDGADHVWSITVPAGTYHVMLVMGDPTFKDHVNSVLINGTAFPDTTVGNDFDTIDADVASIHGAITVRAAPGAVNPTVCFIHIKRLTSQ